MAQPWRFWITGAAAVVWTAVTQTSLQGDAWRSLRSRYAVDETARRIGREARERGMPTFASWASRGPGSLVLVLGTDEGQTAVVQPEPGAALRLPLTVFLSAAGGGRGARVMFSDSLWLADHAELPIEVATQVAALPALIDAAIRA